MESKKLPVLYCPVDIDDGALLDHMAGSMFEANYYVASVSYARRVEPYIPVARVREMIAKLRADQSDAIDWSSRVDALEILIADVEEP